MVRSFHYPAASLESRVGEFFVGLFASLLDVRTIVPFNDGVGCGYALVARIGTEIVLPSSARHLDHELVQRGLQQFYVMCVCAADDER